MRRRELVNSDGAFKDTQLASYAVDVAPGSLQNGVIASGGWDCGTSKYFITMRSYVIDADGKYLGKYRKQHIPQTKGFWEKYYFTPGTHGYPVFDTAVGKVGVQAGAGASLDGEITLKGGKLVISAKAAVALGIGVSAGIGVEIDREIEVRHRLLGLGEPARDRLAHHRQRLRLSLS